MLTMDDLESDVVGLSFPDDKDFNSQQPMTYASDPIIYNDVRETITITTTNHQSRLQKSTKQHYSSPVKSSYRSSPDNPRSPSSRRRSPRKFLPPGKPSTSSSSVPNKHFPHKTLYQNKHHDEAYTSSLLKKVKEYDTTAITPARSNRYKESSLKDKLNNMSKLHSEFKGADNNDSSSNKNKDISNESVKIEDFDDDDIDILRRLALDTQQSKHDDDDEQQQQQQQQQINNNNSTDSENTQTISSFNGSDHNVEELQLRAQALKTAVMNKCKNKGLFIKKRDKAIKDEATYNDSLLNDVIENIEENSGYSPGASPVHYNRASDFADMELDSDVEREKINSQPFSPYSPTDEIEGDTFTDSYLATDSLEENKNQEMIDLEAPYSPSDIPATAKLSSQKNEQHNNYPISDSVKSYLPNSLNLLQSSMHLPLKNVELNNISTFNPDQQYTAVRNTVVSNLSSPLEQSNNSLLLGNLPNKNKLQPIEQIKSKETVINLSVRRAKKKDSLYDEVIRDLEEDYGPICRDNEINNKVNVNSKLLPAPILKINKHLQQLLPLKKIDNNNTVKVFKSAEMQPVGVNNQSVKINTTFKPIKIPQPVKKSLASTSAEAFDSSINDDDDTTTTTTTTINELTIINSKIIPGYPLNNNHSKSKPGRPKTPAKKITTTSATDKTCYSKDGFQNYNKEQKTGKSKSITELSTITNRLEKKSDETLKQTKDNSLAKVSKVKNSKKPESLTSTSVTNDNKRRSSFEEEELRALALASVSKRLKQSASNNKDSDSTKELKINNVLLEKSNEITSKESTTNNLPPIKNNVKNREKQIISKSITPSNSGISSNLPGVTSNNNNNNNNIINNNKKRSIAADCQGPPKKIIKKSIKPTERISEPIQSTVDPVVHRKFVQNKKKKKVPSLLQQSNAVNNNNNINKMNDPIDSLTSKITSTKKIQRMVINLAEDSDTDSELEQLASASLSKSSNFKIPAIKSTKSLSVPGTDFEKRIEDFLRSQREKTESTASKSLNATTNSSDFSKTPQAMRHMPPDKLEEYRRLKQRAAELEKNKTNDKRTRNSDKPTSLIKSTESITTINKSLPKKMIVIKPGVEQTSASINAISTSISAKTLSPDKSTNFSINTNNIKNNSSELSSKREENQLKILANCSQEILKIIPKANEKILLLRETNDDNFNDETTNTNLTDETNAQNVIVKSSSSDDDDNDDDDEITEAAITTASNDSFEYINNQFNDSITESFTFEEQKVDPNIIKSILEPTVVKMNSNVINWPRVSTDDVSVNNKFDKLVIQISNTRDIDVSSRRQVNVIKKDNDKKSESVNSKEKVAPPILRILTADQLNMRANHSVTISTTTKTKTTATRITETMTNSQEQNNVMLNYNNKILPTCDDNNIINEITIEEENETKVDRNIEIIPESLVSTNRTNNNSELLIDNSSQFSKNYNTINTATATDTATATATATDSLLESTERINAEIKVVIDNYKLLCCDEQQSKLAAMESQFTEKKQMELDAYNILTGNLKELEVERQIQLDLSSQVKKLRAELKLAEERLKVQQEKLSGITSKIMTNKSVVNDRRIECNNHGRICTEMGLIVIGKDYKVPPVGNQLSRDAMKEVANRIKRLRQKKTGSVDIGSNSDQQSNDDQSSISSKDTGNSDDFYNLNTNNQLNEELVAVKIENSSEPLNSDISQVNLLSNKCNKKDSTNDTSATVKNVDCQSGNDSIVIKDENVENDSTETTSCNLNSRSKINDKNNNPEGIRDGVSIKQEIIDIELESLPVDSEFTISYPNLESELNQIEMNCIAKNEQDKEPDEFNELESRLTPIDPTLPEESYPVGQPIIQENNINSIEPKTENDNYTSTDTNLSLPVFSNAPPVSDMSLLIRPTVVQALKLSSSSGGNPNIEFQEEKPLLNIDSSSKIPDSNNYSSNRRKGDEKKIKLSQPVQSYKSILPTLNRTRNLDPNAVLCPFELKGTCKDDACIYAHLNHRSTS